MAKIVYDEWYGELTFAQRAAYRKYNIPPALHTELVERFGNNGDEIVKFIKDTVARKGRVDYGDAFRGGDDAWF
jgi:hypothetical protein